MSTTSPDCVPNPVVDTFSGPVFVDIRLQSERAARSGSPARKCALSTCCRSRPARSRRSAPSKPTSPRLSRPDRRGCSHPPPTWACRWRTRRCGASSPCGSSASNCTTRPDAPSTSPTCTRPYRPLIVLITETGLRATDACTLPFDPLLTDSTGWPCPPRRATRRCHHQPTLNPRRRHVHNARPHTTLGNPRVRSREWAK